MPSSMLSGFAAASIIATSLVVSPIAHAAPAAVPAPAAAAAAAVPSSKPAGPTDATKVPHYYGPWPNWALSPLTSTTAEVTISDPGGPGTGATGTAVIDPATGGVTAIDVTAPGHDYVNPQVTVTGSLTGVNATATATKALSGGVVSYAIPKDAAGVPLAGSGYSGFAVAVDPPTDPAGTPATAVGFGAVDSVSLVAEVNGAIGGAGYTMPTVEFALPDDPNGRTATGHVEPADLVGGVVQKVTVDDGGSGYATAPEIVIRDGTAMDPILGATIAKAKTTLKLDSVVVRDLGSGYTTTPAVTVTDTANPAGGTGAQATATVDIGGITGITVATHGAGYLKVGIRKFQDELPMICSQQAGNCANSVANPQAKYIPIGDPEQVTVNGQVADQYVIGLVQYRTTFNSDLPATLARGYVQLETPANVAFSQHFPLTNELLDGTKVPVTDGAGNQVYGLTGPQWLGPTLVATKDKPVRVIFHNYLPKGAQGDLFLPTDSSMMGSGMGPMTEMPPVVGNDTVMDDIRNPQCTQEPKNTEHCFTDNRATLHLHGGITPWISDGTPHQWITPAGENTQWPQGVSVSDAPDMKDNAGNTLCGAATDGCQTFYYTNQQSARLMFYHDHSWGITRLNVYAGEAAGYIITDDVEKKLIADRLIPGAADTIPLIVQDRTFVPGNEQLKDVVGPDGTILSYGQDPTWDTARWGSKGSFWYHHVYMPAQNPGDAGGMSAYGRWMYGPWFWPPAAGTKYGPIENPYYDPTCNIDLPETWQYQTDPFCEPAMIPGTPNISAGMEQFNDTPIVNGVAYPTVQLDPKAYRLRLLNAANDRFFNLQWYQADTDPKNGGGSQGGTEVKLKQSELDAAQTDPNVFPTPENASYTKPDGTKVISTNGPDWVQIANEGGFLPTPAVIDGQQPTTWITDPTRFDVGNVDQHSMLLAPAERADAIVDFSAYAGKTLILYNDAPAAFPARVSSYDYYTGGPDLSPVGAPKILPGYGPNTRTVMRVKIRGTAQTPGTPFSLTALTKAFQHKLDGSGVFEKGQHPIIVGQAAYNTAYGSSFASTGNCSAGVPLSKMPQKCDGYVKVNDTANFRFNTLRSQNNRVEMPLQPKAIHDEMNSTTFDEFGRMQANLGVEASPPTPGAQNVTLYPFTNPQTELIDGTKLPKDDLTVTPIADLGDGTQIWRITHNGVDTHPIHFHLYDVQVINRITWDNIVIPNDPNENGWKDTVRTSPLEDTIVALRPVIPKVPFEVPNSVRPLNPMMPIGSTDGFFNVDVNGNPTASVINSWVNFGWEYVYHCHILSHEEMDMMRPVSLALPPRAPDQLMRGQDATGPTLTWSDNSITETSFDVMRSTDGGVTWAKVGGLTSPLDPATPNEHGMRTVSVTIPAGSPDVNGTTRYKVVAHNLVGYGGDFPSMDAKSESQPLIVGAPLTPTNLAASLGTPEPVAGKRAVTLTWTPDPNPAMGMQTFAVQRSATPDFAAPVTIGTGIPTSAATAGFTDPTLQPQSTTVYYRVMATIGGGLDSQWSPGLQVDLPDLTPATPVAPTLALGAVNAPAPTQNVDASWTANTTYAGAAYTLQRASDPGFTANVGIVGTATDAGAAMTLTDAARPESTTWYYRLQATQFGKTSAWGPAASQAIPTLTPAAPTGLTFSLGTPEPVAGARDVTLTWDAATGVTWEVQRSLDPAFPAAGTTSLGTGLPSPTVVNTAQPQATNVHYRVRAVSSVGVPSAWTTLAVVLPDLTPGVPTGLSATQGAQSGATAAFDVLVSWDAVDGVAYTLTRSTSADGTGAVPVDLTGLTVSAGRASVTDPALPHNQTYHYWLTGAQYGKTSAPPATTSVTLGNLTPAAPTVTLAVGVPQEPTGGQDVTVTWTQVSPATYTVTRSLDPTMAGATPLSIVTDPVTGAMSATDPLVPPGTTVYYVVTVSQYGLTASSAPISATTGTITVAAPTGLQVQVGPVNDPNPTFDVTLTWVEAPGTTYRVERSLDPAFPTAGTTTVTAVSGGATGTATALDPALPHNTTVYYRVIAIQFGVDSPPATGSATTPNLTPAQPAVTAGLVNPHQVGLWDVSLTWTPDPLLTYVLERTSDPTQQTGWTTVPFTTPGAATDANQSAGGQTLWYRLTAYRLGVPSIPGSTSVTLTPLNPAPPQNVQLAWGNPAAPGVGEVTVTWTAVTGESYAVQHSLDGATWQAVGGSVPAGPLVDTGVPHATTVFYRVTATAYGLTATTQASITTPNLTPAAPSITSVTAGNPHATGLYDVTVSWSATGTTYDVYRTVGTGVAQQIATGTSATSVVDLDQAMLTTVTYEVVAHAYGLASAPSAPASLALPDLTPGAPADIQFAPSNPAGPPAQVDVSVSWTTVAGVTYTVEHSLDNGATWQPVGAPVSAGPVSDTGVPHASTVLYRVTAAAYGMSTSATASFSTPDITPAVPTGVTAAVGVSTPPVPAFPVTVSWSGPTGASFTVERSLNGGAFAQVATTGVDVTSWTDPAVPHQSTVAYRVSSQQYGLTSVLSAAGTASTPSLTPATPVVTLSPSGAWPLTVTVSWPAVPGAVSYAVQRTDPAGTVVSLGSGAATTIVDSNAEFGTAYTYAVTVTNDYALSSTGSSSLTTPAGTLIAPDPVALNVLATGTSPGLVVTWTGGQPWARGYRVEISRDATFATGVIAQTATVPATSVTFTGLTRNATYYVRVQATRPNVTNPGPVIGPWTTSTSQRVSAPPMPRPTATAQTGGIIVLRWATAPQFPVGTYQIQIRRSTGGWANVSQSMINMTTNTATITGLTPGATYRFQMRAQNSAGWSSWSDVLTVRAR